MRGPDAAIRIAIDGSIAVCTRYQRSQEVRYSHSGIEQLNKINRRNALALHDLQYLTIGHSTSARLALPTVQYYPSGIPSKAPGPAVRRNAPAPSVQN